MVISDSVKRLYEQAIKSQWEGVCTVYVRENQRDPITNLTRQTEAVRLEGEPCRLCFKQSELAAGDNAADIPQQILLLVDKDADIPPGSRIEVTQNGETASYRHSGAAGVYTVHKEIALERWGEKA